MMMKRIGITAIITCYNEEERIADAIRSVLWADEILIVDSFSTDKTVAIIRSFEDVRLLQHTYETPSKQKNWAIPQASHPWIFLLDADEMASKPLIEEVKITVQSDPDKDAYWIYRQNYFMGKKLRFIWRKDKVIRLFLRDKCLYNDVFVHEEIEQKGISVGYLKQKLLHYSFKSRVHYRDKIVRYADWQALDYSERTPKVTIYHLWIKPMIRFLKHYVLQGGILDGPTGFYISKTMAWGVYLRYVKIRQLRK